MSNYTLFVKRSGFPKMNLSFVNTDTNDIILERNCDCYEESAITHVQNMFLDIQSALPKGHKMTVQVVQVDECVA